MALSIDTDRQRLDAQAEVCGQAWARSVRTGLQRQGRRASGGWPGTLTEARTRVSSVLGRRAPVPEANEQERLARIIYHAARTFWLARREAHEQ